MKKIISIFAVYFLFAFLFVGCKSHWTTAMQGSATCKVNLDSSRFDLEDSSYAYKHYDPAARSGSGIMRTNGVPMKVFFPEELENATYLYEVERDNSMIQKYRSDFYMEVYNIDGTLIAKKEVFNYRDSLRSSIIEFEAEQGCYVFVMRQIHENSDGVESEDFVKWSITRKTKKIAKSQEEQAFCEKKMREHQNCHFPFLIGAPKSADKKGRVILKSPVGDTTTKYFHVSKYLEKGSYKWSVGYLQLGFDQSKLEMRVYGKNLDIISSIKVHSKSDNNYINFDVKKSGCYIFVISAKSNEKATEESVYPLRWDIEKAKTKLRLLRETTYHRF